MDYLEKVNEFQKIFNNIVKEKPDVTDEQLNNIILDLISEKWHELQEALDNKNLIQTLNTLANIQYIISESIVVLGLKNIFNEAFDRIHQSNLSKACKTIEEAEKTLRLYKINGVEAYYEKVNGVYIVYRMRDNQVLKSINYKAANLNDLI